MNLQSNRVLIVDDYRDAADTTADVCRMSGDYEVKTAYNGEEAVALARTFRPGVVVLDVNMPVMNGYVAARMLRDEQAPDAKLLLVALTGRNDPEDTELAAAAGFDHHFIKPLMNLDLFEVIASFFANTKAPATP